jgi:hypothetical protein
MTVFIRIFSRSTVIGAAENFFSSPSFNVQSDGDYNSPVYVKLGLTYPPRSPKMPELCRHNFLIVQINTNM